MNLELLETKINRASSILHLLSSDLENPAGACIESIQIEVIDMALETLGSALEMIDNIK